MKHTLRNVWAIGLGLLLALASAGCDDGGSGSPTDAGDSTPDAGNGTGTQDGGETDGGDQDGDAGETDGGPSGSSALPRPELPRPPRDGLPSELRPPR